MTPNISQRPFDRFSFQTLDDLRATLTNLGLDLPLSENIELLKQPKFSNNISIANRLSIQPMEGFDANSDGSPSKLTLRRYKRYAQSGVGLIWFEATAISFRSRSNSHQLVLNKENRNYFSDLVAEIRERCNQTLDKLGFKEECTLIIQLNHSGRYTKIEGVRYPIRAYENSELDKAIKISSEQGIIVSDQKLKQIKDAWIQQALIAKEVGFDGVDIKACHGYLINELLSARIRNDSNYGGPELKNRAKFLLDIFKTLKTKLADKRFIITTRLNIYDGIEYPYGFGVSSTNNEDSYLIPADLTEPIKLIKELHKEGLRLINLSCGNPYYQPYITRPFDDPINGAPFPPEHPLKSLNRLMLLTSKIKKVIPEDIIVIGSGFSYLRQFAGNLAAGMIEKGNLDICGFGRMAFANPEFPKQIFHDEVIDQNKTCIACSKCSELMRNDNPTGCVIRDPHYRVKINTR